MQSSTRGWGVRHLHDRHTGRRPSFRSSLRNGASFGDTSPATHPCTVARAPRQPLRGLLVVGQHQHDVESFRSRIDSGEIDGDAWNARQRRDIDRRVWVVRDVRQAPVSALVPSMEPRLLRWPRGGFEEHRDRGGSARRHALDHVGLPRGERPARCDETDSDAHHSRCYREVKAPARTARGRRIS